MGAHGNEVATLLFHPAHNLAAGIAEGKFGAGGNTSLLKFDQNLLEVGGIFGDLGTDGVATISARGPTICDMEQYHAALGQLRQRLHVLDDGTVAWRAVEGYENCFVHRPPLI
jgi:hypothetical protein